MTDRHDNPTARCKELLTDLSAYFDDQLAPDDRRAIDDHLQTCTHCQRIVAEYAHIRDAMNAKPASAPPSLVSAVIAQVERDQLLSGFDELAQPTPSRSLGIIRGLAVAAMIAIVAIAATLLIQSPQHHASTKLASNETPRYTPTVISEQRDSDDNTLVQTLGAVHTDSSEEIPPTTHASADTEIACANQPTAPAAPPVVHQFRGTNAMKTLQHLSQKGVTEQSLGQKLLSIVSKSCSTIPATWAPASAPARCLATQPTTPAADVAIVICAGDTASWMYARDAVLSLLSELQLQHDVTELDVSDTAIATTSQAATQAARYTTTVPASAIDGLQRGIAELNAGLTHVSVTSRCDSLQTTTIPATSQASTTSSPTTTSAPTSKPTSLPATITLTIDLIRRELPAPPPTLPTSRPAPLATRPVIAE